MSYEIKPGMEVYLHGKKYIVTQKLTSKICRVVEFPYEGMKFTTDYDMDYAYESDLVPADVYESPLYQIMKEEG